MGLLSKEHFTTLIPDSESLCRSLQPQGKFSGDPTSLACDNIAKNTSPRHVLNENPTKTLSTPRDLGLRGTQNGDLNGKGARSQGLLLQYNVPRDRHPFYPDIFHVNHVMLK